MKKIYLHIGSHKTGSTALQNFLNNNRDILIDNGVLYPRFGVPEEIPHHIVIRPVIEPRDNDYIWDIPNTEFIRTREDIRNCLEEELKQTGCNSVIISTECLFVNKPLFSNVPVDVNLASYIKELFCDYEVIPLVYLRNQCDWIESCYVEAVKGAHTSYSGSFDEYFFDNSGFCDYWLYLRPWTISFPGGVSVFCYEKVLDLFENIEKHFIDFLGLSGSWGDFVKHGAETTNPSLSKEFVAVLVEFNSLNKKLSAGHKYIFPFALGEIIEKGWTGRGKYLSKNESINFLDSLSSSNLDLEKYFNDNFEETWKSCLFTRKPEGEYVDYKFSIRLLLESLCFSKLSQLELNKEISESISKNEDLNRMIKEEQDKVLVKERQLHEKIKEREAELMRIGKKNKNLRSELAEVYKHPFKNFLKVYFRRLKKLC